MPAVVPRSRRVLVGTVSALAVGAIAVSIFLALSSRETPTAVATRALTALAERDAEMLAATIRGDEMFDAALEHVDAIQDPVADIDVEDVAEWSAEDGVDQARVTFRFTVGDIPVEGELVAVREPNGDTYVQLPVLLGEVNLPGTHGGQAQLAGFAEAAEAIHLLPGVYGVAAGTDIPFPYTLTTNAVTVIPGSSETVAPERDESAVRNLLSATMDTAQMDARRAAEAALTDGSVPTDSATSFGRPGRGFRVVSVTETTPASYDNGVVTRHYLARFAAEQYNGSLAQEWMPVEGSATITVAIPVDETGAPQAPKPSFDASDLVWGAAG